MYKIPKVHQKPVSHQSCPLYIVRDSQISWIFRDLFDQQTADTLSRLERSEPTSYSRTGLFDKYCVNVADLWTGQGIAVVPTGFRFPILERARRKFLSISSIMETKRVPTGTRAVATLTL